MGYQLFGNQATFMELGSAALLDGNRRRIRLLPLSLFNFFASTGAICRALLSFYLGGLSGSGPHHWHKTKRYRTANSITGRNGDSGRSGNGSALFVRAANGRYLSRQEIGTT
jgi:hypothetical protein